MQPINRNSSGWIYAIGVMGTSMVKIGLTTGAVEERLANLQTGQPFPLSLIESCEVVGHLLTIERAIHELLREKRWNSEWFLNPLEHHSLKELVDQVTQQLSMPLSFSSDATQKDWVERTKNNQALYDPDGGDEHKWFIDTDQYLRTGQFEKIHFLDLIDHLESEALNVIERAEESTHCLLLSLLTFETDKDGRCGRMIRNIKENRSYFKENFLYSKSCFEHIENNIEKIYTNIFLNKVSYRITLLSSPICPFTLEQMLCDDFLPGSEDSHQGGLPGANHLPVEG